MNLKSKIDGLPIAFSIGLSLLGCDSGSVGEYGGDDGGADGSGGALEDSTGASSEAESTASGSDDTGGPSEPSTESESSGATDGTSSGGGADPSVGDACGCLTSTDGPFDTACEEVALGCPTIEVGCDDLDSYDATACLAVAELDEAQLGALECQLNFLQEPSTGTVSISVTIDGGFAGAWSTFHVDTQGTRTGLFFSGVDADGFYGGRVGGDPSEPALACEDIEDANERLVCAWGAFRVGDDITCE